MQWENGEEGVPGFAMDAEPVGLVALGVVGVKQRCFILHKAAGAFCSTTFCDSDGVGHHVRSALKDDSLVSVGGYMWVDLQGCTEPQNREVLQLLFPDMQPSQLEMVLLPDACDVVELQPVKRQYVIGSLACSPGPGHSFSVPCAAELEGEGDVVVCSFACNERFLVTIHAAPFVGLAELLRHVEVEGGHEQSGAQWTPTDHLMGSEQANGASSKLHRTWDPAEILSTLVCFTCEAFLPDPTLLLNEVSNIDEMALLISPDQQDQTDLLRRVALLRRRISNFRTGLYLKERLLQEFVAPLMRSIFVTKESATVSRYKETLEKVGQVSERLDDARDMLNQANLNFVTGVSMRMGQASAGLDFKMILLNQVAVICLPINLIISIFGMNCKVPFVGDEFDSLIPFWCICGVFVLWAFLCMLPLVREAIRGPRSNPIAPYM